MCSPRNPTASGNRSCPLPESAKVGVQRSKRTRRIREDHPIAVQTCLESQTRCTNDVAHPASLNSVSNVRGTQEKAQVTKTKLALNPRHPELVCWGCDKYCPANDLRCGNGTIRTQHPIELFGEDWLEWELDHHIPEPQSVTPEGIDRSTVACANPLNAPTKGWTDSIA
jgi:hypothetical protein